MRYARLSALIVVLLALCSSIDDGVAAEPCSLTPTGTLRVGLNVGNAVTVTKDASTGELRGVAADLGRALASRRGAAFVAVTYTSVGKMADAAPRGEWDVAFLAVDPARSTDMLFSRPYMEVDNTYLVPPDSTLQAIADVDRPGITIGVPTRSAPDLYLARTLQQATLVRGTLAEMTGAVRAGTAQALAADRFNLLRVSHGWAGARVMEGRFMAVEHAIALPRDREACLGWLQDFVAEAKKSGLIQQSIDRNGLRGVQVAP
jgi:polar amino acid transport system substrate-binding protein